MNKILATFVVAASFSGFINEAAAYEPNSYDSQQQRGSSSASNEEKEQKALSTFMYVSGKCGGLSGAEEDACVDRTRNELSTEGKAYFDAYFGK